MRKTKFTFFIILVILTAVLIFIIIGEDKQYDDSLAVPGDSGQAVDMSVLNVEEDVLIFDRAAMINNYQNTLSDILYEYQQLILQQSISREDAVLEIRERVLAIVQIPTELQPLHLRMIIAFSRDLSGYTDEAAAVYKELQTEYDWLFSRFNFLVK